MKIEYSEGRLTITDHIYRCKIAVIVFTRTFMQNSFDQYANHAAFMTMIDNVSTNPTYIPVGVGLEQTEFPRCIKVIVTPLH